MFAEFWSAYPRKVAKRVAEKAFARLSKNEQAAAIAALPAHCKAWESTEMQYIPHPATWINQGRWEDVLESTAPVKTSAWWTSEAETMQKGRELGMDARPGEDMATYRKRIADRIRAA